MFDILVYLFENYIEANLHPDQGTLERELSAAGFDNDDIHQAIDWIHGLEALSQPPATDVVAPSAGATRCYTEAETEQLGAEGVGLLMFLESSDILTPLQRELIIDRAQALNERKISLEQLKWITLIVLWSQSPMQDFIFIEEVLFGGSDPTMH